MAREFVIQGNKLVETGAPLPPVDVLVLGAHNDDEMFPAGYLIGKIGEGGKVGVVVATDGAGSNWRGLEGKALIDHRTEESRKAVEALGGSFLIGYDHPSSSLKYDKGLYSFADELMGVIETTRPSVLLVQSPFEDHYTHIRTTEAGIIAARRSKHKPKEILGYEVWTPLLGMQMVIQNPLDLETAERKLALQSMYESQNEANPYHESTRALNLFNSVMADSHRAAGFGYSELFLDMSLLIHDDWFVNTSAAEYGGGIAMLTQIIRTEPEFQVDYKRLSKEEMIYVLKDICIPNYWDALGQLPF